MITFSKLGTNGRFGNQLFQYAALFSIAKERGYRYGIPYGLKTNNPYFYLFLDEPFEKLSAEQIDYSNLKYFIQESDFTYQPGFFGIPDNTDINGYFQSEKYFKKYKNDILKEYKFKDEINEKAKTIRSITKDPLLSVHIRMGDYKNFADKHPVCSIEYYKKALDYLPKDILIAAFSDEPNEAKNVFDSLNRKYFFPNTNDTYIDMCLMSMCEYHVIANSTFSWWGSWLSQSKETIAPSLWFGSHEDSPKNWSDIYCEGWKII